MDMKQKLAGILVIFGGTGDLTHRKLIPAVYNLVHQDILSENFVFVAVGRQDKTDKEYREEARRSVGQFARFELAADKWDRLEQRLFYRKVDYADTESFKKLKLDLEGFDNRYGSQGNRVFYLAVAPDYFGQIADNLQAAGMSSGSEAWKRIVIEKPFGKDLASARDLNDKMAEVFQEEQTFRIDHYLGKEMVQSIMGVRFANSLFEPLWNHNYIDNVQITSSETLGVENRSDYYDRTGALRDMIQNHMLQILALVAMEPPEKFEPESVRDEKVRLLRAITTLAPEEAAANTAFGQYASGETDGLEIVSYRQENGVDRDSDTETFAALKLQIENPRWQGTPFYIRTGKRLKDKVTEVVIQFKNSPGILMSGSEEQLQPNLLVLRIQPKEEIFLQFNTKKPGIWGKLCPVKMSFCQNCRVCVAEANSPEAYEKLLHDVMAGDSTLFTRWDEVEQSWKIIDGVASTKQLSDLSFPNYTPDTWGPHAADELLAADGRHWWNLEVGGD